MELKFADNPEQNQYELWADGELAGFVQYHLRDGGIAFLHTQTDPRFRGHGVAGRLVQSSLDSARERHLAVPGPGGPAGRIRPVTSHRGTDEFRRRRPFHEHEPD
jgi:predicted GNAT family acetyltransferase